MNNDTIIIKKLKIFAYHGVLEEEKTYGQYFILDIILSVDLSVPCLTDDLNQSVNYDSVTQKVIKTFTAQKDDLIERAAQRVCDCILEEFSAVKAVELTLKKPQAPVDADFKYMGVHIIRYRKAENTVKKKTAVLSLGSNLGDRKGQLEHAINALNHLPKTAVEKVSDFYDTPPFGVDPNQPNYLNCCVSVKTALSPNALLGACLGIESAMDRVRPADEVKAPRPIDIDLLLYEGFASSAEELTVPHPRMAERAFVLVPLSDIFPDAKSEWFDYSKELAHCDKTDCRPQSII